MTPGRMGCYPGSFNPITVAHLALAGAAKEACGLERVDLIVSRVALGKGAVDQPTFADRLAVLDEVVRNRRPWLGLVVSERQLLVDLAEGYDVLVLGADKWAQVLDPSFYGGSVAARDDALRRLPHLALASRPGADVEEPDASRATILHLPTAVAEASSTAARAGRRSWMAPEAEAFDRRTGAWSEPERYLNPG